MTKTYARLCDILLREHKLSAERLTLDATLESLGIDSLGTVELLWTIEDSFHIKLPAEPVELPTLGDVVRYVDALRAGQGPEPSTASTTGAQTPGMRTS